MSQQNPALMHQNWGWTQTEILKSNPNNKVENVYSCQASLCVPSNPGRQVLADMVTPSSLNFIEQYSSSNNCPNCNRKVCPYWKSGKPYQCGDVKMMDNFYRFIFRR